MLCTPMDVWSSLTRLSHTRPIVSYDLVEPEAWILHFLRGRPQKRPQRGIDFGIAATHAHVHVVGRVMGRGGTTLDWVCGSEARCEEEDSGR